MAAADTIELLRNSSDFSLRVVFLYSDCGFYNAYNLI